MKELWKTMDWERRAACFVSLIGILLISAFLWASTRPGILYKGEFLPQQTENIWQGTVLGEETTVTMEETKTEKRMQIFCRSGTTNYSLVGDRDEFVLYRDGMELYRGRFQDGMLLNADGELDAEESFSMIVTASYGGEIWLHNEDGTVVRETPLLLPNLHAISLLLGEDETVRGEPGMAIPAAILLIALVINLWFPQISYYMTIRRWTNYEAEPSDMYYASRTIGNITCGIAVLVLLAMGL